MITTIRNNNKTFGTISKLLKSSINISITI